MHDSQHKCKPSVGYLMIVPFHFWLGSGKECNNSPYAPAWFDDQWCPLSSTWRHCQTFIRPGIAFVDKRAHHQTFTMLVWCYYELFLESFFLVTIGFFNRKDISMCLFSIVWWNPLLSGHPMDKAMVVSILCAVQAACSILLAKVILGTLFAVPLKCYFFLFEIHLHVEFSNRI